MRYILILLIFNFNIYANTNSKNIDWNFLTKFHKVDYTSKFEIKYLDDMKNEFDFQSGSVYWFQNGISKTVITKPLQHSIWYKNGIITDYTPDINQVSINDVDHKSNLVFDFLILPNKILINAYDIKKFDKKFTLIPKEKSLVKSIDVYIDSNKNPYRFVMTDKLNYQTMLTIYSPSKIKKNNVERMEYPKTTEVINHVRHPAI